MAGQIYVIMTGNDNELWPRCLKENLVALGFDKPYFDAWSANDYNAYLDLERATAKPGDTEGDIKGRATLWMNRGTDLTSSMGDLWLHRDKGKDSLYWAETTGADPVFHPYEDRVMLAKPVTKWSRHDRNGKPLSWRTIHPVAKDYIVSMAAMFSVANEDMKVYLRAVVDGDDLSHWHSRAKWKTRLGEQKTLATSATLLELTLSNLMLSITETVKNANGQKVFKHLKNKEIHCSEPEMKAHLHELFVAQQGRCKITGLPMHLHGSDDCDSDMLVSPDRIDSSGHYAIGNMQLVCRFINFWKMAQDNNRFLELLELVAAKGLARCEILER
ncbi:conserved hypothetical protein [Rhizobium sp. EC-SD404]|nr:conserved hypothetical protein [Rhizobium sp. EC-SD404]